VTEVVVRLPGALRPHAEGRAEVRVDGAPTVRDLLARLPAAVRDRVLDERGQVRPHVNVFVGETCIRETAGLDTPLGPADRELSIIPAVSGGRR
jgi:molybdopterin synthase sulfur carrier subunit